MLKSSFVLEPVDETAINFPAAFQQLHGFAELFEAGKFISRDKFQFGWFLKFVGSTFIAIFKRTAIACMMLAIRIYYRQFKTHRNLCKQASIHRWFLYELRVSER